MKRLLVCLVPWMAMTAAASGDVPPKPAEVTFTHHSPATAWRIGDECWVSPTIFDNWGWTCTFVQSEATIEAEGRTLKVGARTIDNKMAVPLTPCLEQLGAGFAWKKNVDSFDVWSVARSVYARDGKISIAGTVTVKPKVTLLQSPSRIAIDLKGMRLDGSSKLDLEATARIAQFAEDTVRITVMSDMQIKDLATLEKPTRSFDLAYKPGIVITPPISPVGNQGTTGNSGLTIPIVGPTFAGPVSVTSDGERTATIAVPLNKKLPKPLIFERPDPLTIQLSLPGVSYRSTETPPGAPLTFFEGKEEGGSTILTMKLERPMGVEVSSTATQILIRLTKPAVGNGLLAGKIVVVDAGHGAHDSGAKAPDKSVYEKDLNLSISKLVAEELAAHGATVIMTRKTDVFIDLKERAYIANRNKADFFLSVHINSTTRANSTSGTIIFYRGGKPDSKLLAECIESETKKVSGLPSIGVWSDTKIYDTGFAVLRHSTMPNVLVETGFINHSKDRARMKDPEFQKVFAAAIVKGIRVYLGDVKPQD